MTNKKLIADSVLDLIGNTPIVRLNKLPKKGSAEVLLKMESCNPGFSVKDRLCAAMIDAAEKDGTINKNVTIIEPTTGNTGIGLAMVCAVKGYKLVLTMPDNMSDERKSMMLFYGAQVILTPAKKGMQGAIDKAKEIMANNPACFMPQQFANPANIRIHRETTAQEILTSVEGKLDAFVAGVGTGGTISGVGEVLKEKIPDIKIIAVEPETSAVLSGKNCGFHRIQGLGAGFVPETLNQEIVDEILTCSDQNAYKIAKELGKQEGISAGISAGAAVYSALKIAEKLGKEKRVLAILPDAWERYISQETEFLGGDSLNFII